MSRNLVAVFDLGGVFIDWNPAYLFEKLFDNEEEARWFHKHVCSLEWNLEFDAGKRFENGIAELIPRHPRYWKEIQAYDQRWEEMTRGLYQGTIDIQEELIAANISTYAITNFSYEKWVSMLEKWDFLSNFDGVVVSGNEKIVKPDPRIYKIFCDRFGQRPEDCVFIDDNEVNIYSARAFGMTAIHFTSPEALRTDLINLGFPLKKAD